MKVLLVNPPYKHLYKRIQGSSWLTPPLGLAYLAAVLENDGHKVRIEDLDIVEQKENYLDYLRSVVNQEKPQLVGITSTTPNIYRAWDIAKLVKELNVKTKTVLGGPHPSVMPEESLSCGFVDFVVIGEGELTIKELCRSVQGNGYKLSDIKGLFFKEGRNVIKNPPSHAITDLDNLPFPARHLLNFEQYTHPLMKEKTAATILTGRGCPFSCTFCNKRIFGSLVRLRSVENIVKEIIEVNRKFNIQEFHIIDDMFNIDVQRVERFCKKIIELNKNFKFALPNGIRADMFPEATARLMKRAGFYSVSFGIESGNTKTLKRIKKQLDLSKAEAAFEAARRAGLETVAFIIVGFPHETEEDLNNTLRFLRRIKPDVVDFQTLIPLPGTEIYAELKANNQIVENDWSKYTFHDRPVFFTEYLSRDRIAVLYRKAYFKYHIHPATIWVRLKKIRSLRDLMINIKGTKTIIFDTWLKK